MATSCRRNSPGCFPSTDFVAFFRDPFQQAVSHYEFLRRLPEIDHPVVREFRAARMTLQDFIAWDAVSDPQTQLIGGFAPEDFAMIGLTEEFERSIALFNAIFGRDLANVSENANPARGGSGYAIDADLRDLIARHRAADIDLYRRAQARFTRLTSVPQHLQVGACRRSNSACSTCRSTRARPISSRPRSSATRLSSILDVGACWGVHGGYTFHALESGRIERAVIADGDVTTLTRARAAADPRIALAEGNIGDAAFIDALPPSDAAIMFDVLLHQVAPDWDEFLAPLCATR